MFSQRRHANAESHVSLKHVSCVSLEALFLWSEGLESGWHGMAWHNGITARTFSLAGDMGCKAFGNWPTGQALAFHVYSNCEWDNFVKFIGIHYTAFLRNK